MDNKLQKQFDKHFQTQDLENGIWTIRLKLNKRIYKFYGVSEAEAEANAIDFINQVYNNSDLLELWKEGH
jgi:hypothetical protein